MWETRRATRNEMKKLDREFKNDDRELMLVGFHGEERVLGQLDSLQTIGFNLKQLLNGTNADRFEIRLATKEDLAYFMGKDTE